MVYIKRAMCAGDRCPLSSVWQNHGSHCIFNILDVKVNVRTMSRTSAAANALAFLLRFICQQKALGVFSGRRPLQYFGPIYVCILLITASRRSVGMKLS